MNYQQIYLFGQIKPRRLLNAVDIKQMFNENFSNYRIWTADILCSKWPLANWVTTTAQ